MFGFSPRSVCPGAKTKSNLYERRGAVSGGSSDGGEACGEVRAQFRGPSVTGAGREGWPAAGSRLLWKAGGKLRDAPCSGGLWSERTDGTECLSGSRSPRQPRAGSLVPQRGEGRGPRLRGEQEEEEGMWLTPPHSQAQGWQRARALHRSPAQQLSVKIRAADEMRSFFSFTAADSFQRAEKRDIKYRKRSERLPVSGQMTPFAEAAACPSWRFPRRDCFPRANTAARGALASGCCALSLAARLINGAAAWRMGGDAAVGFVKGKPLCGLRIKL